MHRQMMKVIAIFPLLLSFCYAAQTWSVDPPGQLWAFSSEEGGTTSYLGVDIADVTGERLSALKLKEEKGVEVTMVDQDAPAGKAGIKEHDVILTMNGTAIESGAQLRRMIHETPPGRVVTLGLSRDGQPMSVKVQLADKHKELMSWKGPKPPDIHMNVPEMHMPDIDIPSFNMVMITTSARSGLMVENITPQLGEFFGVKNGNGVLVRSVEKGSRAEKAGFHAGDVIVKVNDQSVHDTSDFLHEVKSRSGNSVSVAIIREKREQSLTLTLPEKKDSSEWWQEESFDTEQQAQSEEALTELRGEMAKMRPYMKLAAGNSGKQAGQLRKEVLRERNDIRCQTEKQREHVRGDLERLRRELLQMRQDWL